VLALDVLVLVLVLVLEAGALTSPPPIVTWTTLVITSVFTGRCFVTTRGRRGLAAAGAAACALAFSAASRAVLASARPVTAPVAPATAQVASPVTAATANR
jgi:hypothetical protein